MKSQPLPASVANNTGKGSSGAPAPGPIDAGIGKAMPAPTSKVSDGTINPIAPKAGK